MTETVAKAKVISLEYNVKSVAHKAGGVHGPERIKLNLFEKKEARVWHC